MSSSVSPASATAARHASTVNDSGSTMSRRPSAERPTPESTARCSNRSLLTGARGAGRSGSATSSSDASDAPVGSNNGNHTSSCGSNRTVTSWPMCTSSGSQPTTFVVRCTVGSSASATIGDRVRRLEAGQPLVLVDRETDDGRAPGHNRRAPRAAAARGADRHGRMHQRLAIVAALHAQLSVRAGGPEPLVDRRELRERPHLRTCRRGTRPHPSPRGTTP